MSAQLVAHDLAFAHGPTTVLAGVSLTVAPGHRVGVVGPNGVGKSTLLSLLAGDLVPDGGRVELVPSDARVGHLTQELLVRPYETVEDVIWRRTGALETQKMFDRATTDLAAGSAGADDRYATALERWLRAGVAELDHHLEATLDRVGLDATRRRQPATTLSGGQRARVNLACVLLAGFDVLCLDEPTNDLDLAGLELLEEFLVSSSAGYVLVSHDRAFLEHVVTGVLELDEHSRRGTRFDGGWRAYQDERAAARRHAEQAHERYLDERRRLEGQARQVKQWAAAGVRVQRRRPSDGDKLLRNARIEASENLAGRAKRTERALERLEVVDKPWEGWDLRLQFPDQRRAGDEVLRVRDLVVERRSFRLGPVDLDVGHGERVALLGPNGSGKTTLLAAALGTVRPDRGEARLGPSVVPGTLDQHRTRFEDGEPLLDAFVAETGVDPTAARSQLAKLGLGAEHVARPTGMLSPGERTRAFLAAFALVGVNLLVLDEPTNHLDLPAIEQLEAALEHFPGTLVLVTHDRRLLDAVHVTRRIHLAGGRIVRDELP